MLDGCKLPGCPLLRLTLRSSDRNLLIIYSSGAGVLRLFLFCNFAEVIPFELLE